MNTVELKVPSDPQFLQAIRLTTSSLANRLGFDIDDVEDLKVLISEVVTYVIPLNEEIVIKFELYEDKIHLIVEAEKVTYESENIEEESRMKKQILMTLADDISFTNNTVTVIKNK